MHPDDFPIFEVQFDFESSDEKFPTFPPNSPRKAAHQGCVSDYVYEDKLLAIFSSIGRRKTNLDKFSHLKSDDWTLLAIYDGHSDHQIASYLESHLLNRLSSHPEFLNNTEFALEQVFEEMEKQVIKNYEYGSTALVVLVHLGSITVANLGDSKLFGITQSNLLKDLIPIHNLTNSQELMKVCSRGGIIFKRGHQNRINGQLNLSRCFGDKKLKYCMNSQPDIYKFCKSQFSRIVLATDGFYCAQHMERRLLLKSVKELDSLATVYQDNATAIYYRL